MELNERQRGALEAICDTICPESDGLPTAIELGVPDALLEAIDRNPREPCLLYTSPSPRDRS